MAKILKSPIPYKQPVSENLVELVKIGLRRHADKTIVIDSASDRHWTGAELEHQISVAARFLKNKCNLQKGDICTIYGEPNDKNIILILAVIAAGGVAHFLTNQYKIREVLDTSETLNAKFLISTKDSLENMKDQLVELEDKISVISSDQICEGYKNACYIGASLAKREVGAKENLDQLISETQYDVNSDFAVIQFSSGTTGKPKPIPRTHKNLCHLVASVDHEELMDLKSGQVITGSLPVTHRPGLWALLACINGGATLVLWNNLSNVEEALQMVEKYKVTILSCSLSFFARLGNLGVKLKDKYDLTSFKHIITSGAKIVHSDLPELLMKEFKLKTLRQSFGMTESGWVFLIENSQANDNYLTVGHVVPSTEVAILDRETLKPVGPEVRGELALRGPQVFPGYLTSVPNVYNRSDYTEDGWFRCGDQAYYDSKDLVFIEGRYKEWLILSNDERHFPSEIESVISEHPSVEGSCVINIGVKDGFYDIARAYVTLKQNCKLTEQELINFVSNIAHDIILEGGVRILEEFPRLQNGKIDKQLLKSRK